MNPSSFSGMVAVQLRKLKRTRSVSKTIKAIRALHRMALIGTAGFRCRPSRT
jgi:hypothetical protein